MTAADDALSRARASLAAARAEVDRLSAEHAAALLGQSSYGISAEGRSVTAADGRAAARRRLGLPPEEPSSTPAPSAEVGEADEDPAPEIEAPPTRDVAAEIEAARAEARRRTARRSSPEADRSTSETAPARDVSGEDGRAEARRRLAARAAGEAL